MGYALSWMVRLRPLANGYAPRVYEMVEMFSHAEGPSYQDDIDESCESGSGSCPYNLSDDQNCQFTDINGSEDTFSWDDMDIDEDAIAQNGQNMVSPLHHSDLCPISCDICQSGQNDDTTDLDQPYPICVVSTPAEKNTSINGHSQSDNENDWAPLVSIDMTGYHEQNHMERGLIIEAYARVSDKDWVKLRFLVDTGASTNMIQSPAVPPESTFPLKKP